MKAHVVTVVIIDHRSGKRHNVAFSHSDAVVAEALRNLIKMAQLAHGGAVHQFSSERMDHLQVSEVHGPAALDVLETSQGVK